MQALGGGVRELDQVVENVVSGDRVEIYPAGAFGFPTGAPRGLDG
jgi:hypothetical protein